MQIPKKKDFTFYDYVGHLEKFVLCKDETISNDKINILGNLML